MLIINIKLPETGLDQRDNEEGVLIAVESGLMTSQRLSTCWGVV